MSKSIYLCGPITKFSYKWRNKWGNQLNSLGYIVSNPETFKGDNKSLVVQDLDAIDRSDVILVNLTKISIGTSMEISYSFQKKKPIILVATNKYSLSIWHEYMCTHIVDSFEKALSIIKES